MNIFNFKRGDSVIINVISNDGTSVESDTGIVLETRFSEQLEDYQIECRRDKDGSLWTCNKDGKSHRFTEGKEQFLQIQKVFGNVELKRGKVISMINVYDGGAGPKLVVWDGNLKQIAEISFNLEDLMYEKIQLNYMDERALRAK